MIREIGKDVPEFEGLYEVSNCGSIRKTKSKYVLKPQPADRGYLTVVLSNKGKFRKFRVHRLVAQLFVPNPHFEKQVRHKNGITNDNRPENLEGVSRKENSKTYGVKAKRGSVRYDVPIVTYGRGVEKTYENYHALGKALNIPNATMSSILNVNSPRKSHKGIQMRYIDVPKPGVDIQDRSPGKDTYTNKIYMRAYDCAKDIGISYKKVERNEDNRFVRVDIRKHKHCI